MKYIKIDKIVFSKRKTISITIDKDAKVIVRAPNGITRKRIENFVKEKENWIISKKKEIIKHIKEIPLLKFKDGDELTYRGNSYKMEFQSGMTYPIIFNGKKFIFSEKYQSIAKRVLEIWYKNEAIHFFHERAFHFAQILNVSFNRIKISNAQRRWGSCSTKKNINLSWKLMMAPDRIIDYIIVHELAHLIELNHSYRFWMIVENVVPDYKITEKWLNENGHLLTI